MVDFTQPVKTTFELQRKSLEQGQQALEQTVDLQQRVGDAAIDGLDASESVQRSAVELNQDLVHSVLDAIEANVPGTEDTLVELRDGLDEQYDALLENHEELFANLTDEVEDGVANVDEMSEEYLDVLDEQLDMLLEAHEELEGQSVEAVDELGEQVEEIQQQAEEIQ